MAASKPDADMSTLRIEKHPDRGYLLTAECVAPRLQEEVFAFFSSAANLQRITPPWVGFQILTPQPIVMQTGRILDYRIRLRGIPVRWQSEITAWDAPRRFVDEMRRGPYSFWRHEHWFEPCPGGTKVRDEVHYGVPGRALVHRLFVRRDLEAIFRYRQEQLALIFPAADSAVQGSTPSAVSV